MDATLCDMSDTTNRHNIYVVLSGDQRGRIVRKGGHATAGYHYVSPVSEYDEMTYGCEHKDNLALVGCVTTEQWDRTSGIDAEACALAREGVWRTVEHFLSIHCNGCGKPLDQCTGESAR